MASDFYDFLQLDEFRLTMLVADVSGHGVPAALIASMLKVAFAQQAARVSDPASILAGINEILHGVLDSQFVTAACAHIDLEAHTVHLCRSRTPARSPGSTRFGRRPRTGGKRLLPRPFPGRVLREHSRRF